MKGERLPRLVLECLVPPSPPDATWWWCQMVSGMHRLVDVRERFESVSRMRHAQRAFVEFTAALELCWWHCYSVRERAVEFLGVRDANKKAAGKLKNPSLRCAALAVLAARDPALAGQVARLVGLLDSTVARRNNHTHGNYVGLMLDVGGSSFSPEDVIMEAGPGRKGARIRAAVASAIRRKARECVGQIQDVIACLSDLADAGHVALSQAPRSKGLAHINQAAFP